MTRKLVKVRLDKEGRKQPFTIAQLIGRIRGVLRVSVVCDDRVLGHDMVAALDHTGSKTAIKRLTGVSAVS